LQIAECRLRIENLQNGNPETEFSNPQLSRYGLSDKKTIVKYEPDLTLLELFDKIPAR